MPSKVFGMQTDSQTPAPADSTARRDILSAIRRQSVPAAEIPDLKGEWITYPDRLKQFSESLAFVGGQCIRVRDDAEINAQLAQIPPYAQAKKICSLIPGVRQSNVDLQAIADPHQLEDVDYAIIPGEFCVAENGAVWIMGSKLHHRVLPFITQYLAFVVEASQIVDTMHQAYERLSFGPREFGVFISGPSKTADIEQSLVIGAHGARVLPVFLRG